jgi:hypothetical protein
MSWRLRPHPVILTSKVGFAPSKWRVDNTASNRKVTSPCVKDSQVKVRPEQTPKVSEQCCNGGSVKARRYFLPVITPN